MSKSVNDFDAFYGFAGRVSTPNFNAFAN